MKNLTTALRVSLVCASLLCSWLNSCASAPDPNRDLHSYSQPEAVRVEHVSLDLALDFEAHEIRGRVGLELTRPDRSADLVLDSAGLFVDGVFGADGSRRGWSFGRADEVLGSSLTILLEPEDKRIEITYHTEGDTEALQWLEPQQTAGGRHPFLFTQGQSILTRSWIPLQDSPGVRVTYDARITAPEGLTPVMSAASTGRDDSGAWLFELNRPIPAYLIALACGDLVFESISNRCGVWAEPELAAQAAEEFADTEAMIQACERLFGPYRWGRYDILVLPPAFPFGGMENPLLTFATPTILAGDKSLVALIAHELAHSWSGNLVTNATWRDFWLNEGFTVYLEKRIMEEVFGPERANMEKVLDLAGLEAEIEELDDWAEVLHVDLAHRHPDDAFNSIPYEKGALFLRRLEQSAGRERFDTFLRGYFDEHAFQSLTTADFRAYLEQNLLSELSDPPNIDQWLNGSGLPHDAPRVRSTAFEAVNAELERWQTGTPAAQLSTEGWVTAQWLHFLATLPADLSVAQMRDLDEAFELTTSGNSEILCVWLQLATRHDYRPADQRLAEFLTTVGRRKFLTPLYTELKAKDLSRARQIYAQARPGYHAVARGTIDALLE